MLLEKRVEVLSEALEMKDAQLGEVLAAAHLDPATLQQVHDMEFDPLDLSCALVSYNNSLSRCCGALCGRNHRSASQLSLTCCR